MAKKRRVVPNFFTIGNLIGGIFAIIFALTDKLDWAPYCILGAILFDFLDGFMAKVVRGQAEIGKQLDSLADMVTFGVAPGMIIYSLLSDIVQREMWLSESGADWNNLKYAAFLIPIFALFRLAKFNIDTRQADSFIGVPTATAAIFFASFPLIIHQTETLSNNHAKWAVEHVIQNPLVIIVLVILFSVAMVSEIPLFALKFKNFKWKGNEIRFVFLILSLIMILMLKVWSIPIIVFLFLGLSLLNNSLAKKTI